MTTLTRFDAKIPTTVHGALVAELRSSDSPRVTLEDLTVVLGKNGLWEIYDDEKMMYYSLTTDSATQALVYLVRGY